MTTLLEKTTVIKSFLCSTVLKQTPMRIEPLRVKQPSTQWNSESEQAAWDAASDEAWESIDDAE